MTHSVCVFVSVLAERDSGGAGRMGPYSRRMNNTDFTTALDDALADALRRIPAYAEHVAAAGWSPEDGFGHLPLTDKGLVFCGPSGPWFAPGALPAGSEAFTSSGLGGRFSIGVGAPGAAQALAGAVDAYVAEVGADAPLVLSCLPQGIAVPTARGVGAAAGTNIAGALALVDALAARQGGLVLAAEPLCAKELVERLGADDPDGTYPVLVLTGGEWPSEGLRLYLEGLLGGRGRVVFTYGAAELGVGAMGEDPDLVALRGRAYRDPTIRRALTGRDDGPTPALYRWDPRRFHLETTDAGELVVTTLERRPVPLMRYNLADRVELCDGASLNGRLADRAVAPVAPGPICVHYGRAGASGALTPERIKDWLFADPARAAALSGRFNLSPETGALALQRSPVSADAGTRELIAAAVADLAPDGGVSLWEHARYPFHVGGHERKATYVGSPA